MFRKIAIAAAFAVATVSSALAQVESPRMMDNPETMKPFYTDEGMTTLRTPEEISALVKAMSTEDRAKMAEECKNVDSPRASFCDGFNTANGN